VSPHLRVIRTAGRSRSRKALQLRVAGQFYTGPVPATHLVSAVLRARQPNHQWPKTIIDPFSGDGRLVVQFLRASREAGHRLGIQRIELWDIDRKALDLARSNVEAVLRELHLDCSLVVRETDSLGFGCTPDDGRFDLVLTNPPWEVLKPDPRELAELTERQAKAHIDALRTLSRSLAASFPRSCPNSQGTGWGLSLARCGTELALNLTGGDGLCALVAPASLLADQRSHELRRWLFSSACVRDVAYFPAEGRFFAGVDQASVTLCLEKPGAGVRATATLYGADARIRRRAPFELSTESLSELGWCLPIHIGIESLGLIRQLATLATFADLESSASAGLWAGRELDETNHERFLADSGEFRFVKGRHVGRFRVGPEPTRYLARKGPAAPASAHFERVAWRDVARPSQKRRLHAAIIPARWVSGNSLSVARFRNDDHQRLRALLACMNSLVFEFQIRALSATGHVSLGTVRRARMPRLDNTVTVKRLAKGVGDLISSSNTDETQLEVAVARAYGIDREAFGLVLDAFPKVTPLERAVLLADRFWAARKS